MAIVASSSSSSSVVINNEVFISFRGDTRKNFTSHLYSALCRKGIRTYRDDPNLERGDEISVALSRAIEESKISVVVFSKEYASSRWCLNELVHILKCKNERGLIVLPVFYDINPSYIRKQMGSYADAFTAHKERFELKKVEEWRNALTAAADLSGFHSKNYQYESELIEKIVKDVLRKLKRLPQIIIATKGLVGIYRQLEEIESLLWFGLPNPRVIGLWGLGGIGSSLHSQAVEYWEHTWNKLKIIPHSDVQKVLKISYDGLDDKQQDILLDIACFLRGETRDFIESILDNCDLFSSSGIEVLINKSLITICKGEVQMHDLIQEMGWEIVRQQSIKHLGRRSRLWIPQDVYHVLDNNEGTEEIEGIYLDISKIDDALHLEPIVFNKMHRLRLLKIYVSDYSHHSKFKCVKQLWTGVQNLRNLKRINLGYSKLLIKLPDLSRALKLESINLEGCINLVEVPPLNFQGCFGSLTLRGCIKIKSVPNISGNIKYLNLDWTGIKELHLSIGCFESLVELSLRGCQHINNFSAASFPRNIQVFNLSDLSIKQVPFSIELLENLVELRLEGCQHIKHLSAALQKNLKKLNLRDSSIEQVSSSSIEGLDFLREFRLGGCKKLESLPTNIFKSKSLESLQLGDLSANQFENIPSTMIIQLHRLETLNIQNCKKLRSLPQLPSSVIRLHARGCTSLETISSSGCYGFNIRHVTRPFIHKRFTFQNCWKLGRNARSILTDFLYGVDKLNLGGNYCLTIGVCYPGNEIPKWFRHQDEGISTTMKLPHGWHNSNFMGFAICIVASIFPAGTVSNSSKYMHGLQYVEIKFDIQLKTKCGQIHKYKHDMGAFVVKSRSSDIRSDHVFVQCVTDSMFNGHPDAMEASFYLKFRSFVQSTICYSNVKRIGVGMKGEKTNLNSDVGENVFSIFKD
ncbi:TMV resistance protein N-like [Morus notabilis]|uniref:TMV resistance protein N-like n=1 Tax=Morus notabilis TaxID=981085 RepID=UPI000CED478A|nr:TMV resistance protein N-like [Morus notabilis]